MKSLRTKILFTLTLTLTLLVILQSGSVHRSFLESYNELEVFQLETDVKRAQNTIENDLVSLANVAKDTAGWDDTYEFMQTRDFDWIEENFTWEVLKIFNSDTLVITDLDYNIVHSEHRTMEGALLEMPPGVITQITKNDALQIEKNERKLRYGLMSIGEQVMMVGYYHITNTNENLDPLGRLLYGRILNKEKLDSLSKVTQLDLSVRKVSHKNNQATQKITTKVVSDSIIEGSVVLNDIFNKPVIELVIKRKRDFSNHGEETLDYFLINSVIYGLILIIGITLLVDKWVLKRIAFLSKEIKRIGSDPDLTQRIQSDNDDEIGRFAQSMNAALDELAVYTRAADKNKLDATNQDSIRVTLIIDSETEKIVSARFFPDVIAGHSYGRVSGLQYSDLLVVDDNITLAEVVRVVSVNPKHEFSATLTPLGVGSLVAKCSFTILASVRPGLLLCQVVVDSK